ncbi:MAG: nucleoside triphosphate pyrophosphohydrolase [Rickettsiales bacterium]|nr:nucleoside triphosphate pyrophosphohydrolase [Rickettsiales bacterium]
MIKLQRGANTSAPRNKKWEKNNITETESDKGIIMEKLVRDKLPEIVCAKGEDYPTRVAESDTEYADFLRAKLGEEIDEFYSASGAACKIEEIADIMEVIRAIRKFYGIDEKDVELVRAEKFLSRGGFEKRIIWKDVDDYYENKKEK